MSAPDAVTERLLRDALESLTPHRAEGECLDGDVLAGWSEGALSASARGAALAHAADCSRCQAVLATLARISPPPPPPWWRRPLVGWGLSLAAAAVGAGLVVAVWRQAPEVAPHAVTTSAENMARTPDLPPSPDAPPVVEPTRRPVVPSVLLRAHATPTNQPSRADTAAVTRAEAQPASASIPPSERAAPSAGPSAGGPAAKALAAEPARGALDRAAPPLVPASAPAAAAGVADAASAPLALAARRAAVRPAQTVVISASDPRSRWRLLPGSGVEHSADGGATWEVQATGSRAPLAAGVSPAPKVCWLVGARGTVLRTVDGRVWARLTFPQPLDLVEVQASGEAAATVTSSDGQRFATSDGGRTWTPAPLPAP